MKYLILVALLVVSTIARAEPIIPTSMLNLICCAERYIGKKVQVKGYFSKRVSFYLFFSQESAKIDDVNSGIAVTAKLKDGTFVGNCLERYVIVRGVVSDKYGHLALRDLELVKNVDLTDCISTTGL